jgi:hypothetical protein
MPFKHFFCLIIFLFAGHAYGQEKKKLVAPDYDNIEKVTKDKTSAFYYPKLLKRYEANDTTLTEHQIHMLYYGSIFNDPGGRSAFADLNYIDSIKVIHQKDSLSMGDRKKLIGYYTVDLKSSPFSLRSLNAIMNLYAQANDPKAAYYLYKLRSVANVVLSTGDGMTAQSGFHVSLVSDEYALLGMLGFETTGNQDVVGTCDFLQLATNKYELPGLYFDVAQLMKQFNKAPTAPGKKATAKKK